MEDALEQFLAQYQALSKAADAIFDRVKKEHADCVRCKIACTDCCYALFDMSLIEAIYINRQFHRVVPDEKKADLLERANRADRKIHKLKRQAVKDLENGKSEDDILAEMARERIRCPLLNEQDECDLYDHRPITCRLYGIPTEIGGSGRTCGKSGFTPGVAYPTVHLDILHQNLYDMSEAFARAIKSGYAKIGELLMPLSMALLTEFDAEYLGVAGDKKDVRERNPEDDTSIG